MTAIKVAEDFIPKKNWDIRLIDCNRNLGLNNSLSEPILGSEILGGRCDLATTWVKIKKRKEIAWYYPNPCEQCRVGASSRQELRACQKPCAKESRRQEILLLEDKAVGGNLSKAEKALLEESNFKSGRCVHGSSVHLRKSFRLRLASLQPNGESQLLAWKRILKNRPVFWVGDSIALAFMRQFMARGKEVGVDIDFEPTTLFHYPNRHNKSPFRFMSHKRLQGRVSSGKSGTVVPS